MSGEVRVLVISDTHIPDFARELPPVILAEAEMSDMVLHAGDVTSRAVLERLAQVADDVVVVAGNNDGDDVRAWGAQDEVQLTIEGVRIAMLHDSGPSRAREGRMRRRFPDADLVVFGHSHIPLDVDVDGQRLFNPGSPTWKRRQPVATYGLLRLRRGGARTEIVTIA